MYNKEFGLSYARVFYVKKQIFTMFETLRKIWKTASKVRNIKNLRLQKILPEHCMQKTEPTNESIFKVS